MIGCLLFEHLKNQEADLLMKTKANCISQNNLPFTIEVLQGKKINLDIVLANEGLSDIDKAIHEIRKSLRTILAVLQPLLTLMAIFIKPSQLVHKRGWQKTYAPSITAIEKLFPK